MRKVFVALQRVVLYVLLNIYAFIALAVGVYFLAFVPQSREIFANLLDPDAPWRHLVLYLLGLGLWGASIWYSMRLLSTTRFARADGQFAPTPGEPDRLRAEAPRLCMFAALVAGALVSSVYLGNPPTLRLLLLLAIGAPALTWSVMTVGDYVFKPRLKTKHFYSWWVAGITVGSAALVGWGSDLLALEHLRLPQRVAEWMMVATVAAWLAAPFVSNKRVQAVLGLVSLAAWAGVCLRLGPNRAFSIPLLVLLGAAAGLWWTSRRRELHKHSHGNAAVRGDPGPSRFWVLSFTIVVLLALVAGFSNFAIPLGNWLGTFAIVFLALSLWCFYGTVIFVYWPKRKGFASFAIVPLVWAALGTSADHRMHDTKFPPQEAQRPELRAHFEAWRKGLPHEKHSPVFVVAAAGGGLRAAYWTAALLASMDDETCGEFGKHVYAYSGVSGGSLGVAAYLAQRQVWEAKGDYAARCEKTRVDEITRFLNRDFLAPVAGTILFAEAFQRFTFVRYLQNERGAVLANSWTEAWDDVFGASEAGRGAFARPFVDGLGAPAVFLNTTGVDSGRRVIQSNVVAAIPGADDFFGRVRSVDLKTSGLRVSEAVLNSARFTYVSPAGTVEGCFSDQPAGPGCAGGKVGIWDRVVDGGYFENSGLATVTDVLRALRRAKRDEPINNPVFYVIIDNSSEPERACNTPWPVRIDLVGGVKPAVAASEIAEPRDEGPADQSSVSTLSGFKAPVQALLNVREARARLEVRRLASQRPCAYLLDWSLFADTAGKDKEKADDLRQRPALGWFLSRGSTHWMRERARLYATELPFDLEPCYVQARQSRGLLGGPEVQPYRCPADARER